MIDLSTYFKSIFTKYYLLTDYSVLFYPQIAARWSSMVSKVITFVPQPDPSLAPVSIDTLGHVASSPAGKSALNSIGGARMLNAVRVRRPFT